MDTQIRVLLDSLANNMRKHYMDELRRIDLHIGQDQLMCHLDFHDELSQVQLMDHLGCEASTVSNMVKALERRSFVTKRKNASDSRSTLISLTPAGREKIPAIHQSWEVFQEQLLTEISEPKKEMLISLLSQINQNIN